jgi:hypothetical protein
MCSIDSCSNYFIGKGIDCFGEIEASWNEKMGVCCCACSQFTKKTSNKPDFKLNIPLQASRPAVVWTQFTSQPNSPNADDIVRYTQNINNYNLEHHVNAPVYLQRSIIPIPVGGR